MKAMKQPGSKAVDIVDFRRNEVDIYLVENVEDVVRSAIRDGDVVENMAELTYGRVSITIINGTQVGRLQVDGTDVEGPQLNTVDTSQLVDSDGGLINEVVGSIFMSISKIIGRYVRVEMKMEFQRATNAYTYLNFQAYVD